MKLFPVVAICLSLFLLLSGSSDPETGAARLAAEDSPYLRGHADNAVNWYPWGDEAFDRARAEDKPVFVSIGYSACHWCHVMEEESFLDPEVARLLEESFIAVLVDREERPDVDALYITAANLIGGRGGWPLNVIMTADGQPFYTSTYLPRESRPNQVGMIDLLPFIADAWANRRDEILDTAAQVTDVLERLQNVPRNSKLPGEREVQTAIERLVELYDEQNGGFADRPKFPQPHMLLFLLRSGVRSDDRQLLTMAENTLTSIRHGGIYDQVGFGVHRYSVDSSWFVPHFEKMLYDQALLTLAYVEAWEATGNPLFRQSAMEILEYVDRDLSNRRGGFFSSEDADSEGEEGTFYLWASPDLERLLGDRADLILPMLGVRENGNFTDEATGVRRSENILFLPSGFSGHAESVSMTPAALAAEWDTARRRLLEAREERERPFRDEKILADWNGLMIAAFARAGRVFDRPDYIDIARNAFDFVLRRMDAGDGRLYHRYLDGRAGVPAFLDDYAGMLWGALELFEARFETNVLRTDVTLAEIMNTDFLDSNSGGYYLTGLNADSGITRQKISLDSDLPSGNSVAANGLARLARLTGNPEYEDRAWEVAGAFSTLVSRVPEGHAYLLSAVDFLLNPSFEVVIVGRRNSDDTREMLSLARSVYKPGMVVILKDPGDDSLAEIAEFTRYQGMLDGRATAYVCENFLCNLPTTNPAVMMDLLGE